MNLCTNSLLIRQPLRKTPRPPLGVFARVEEAFRRYQERSFLRDDNRKGFEFAGIIF